MKPTLLAVVALALSACCAPESHQPLPPTKALSGWQGKTAEDGKTYRAFFLKKNESTDNGKVGIKVVDVIPGKCFSDGERYPPTVKLQVFRVSDRKVVLEQEYSEGNNLRGLPDISSEMDWDYVHVHSINTKEKWATFSLSRI